LFITFSVSRIIPNLRDRPGLSQGALKLHGWVYKIESGDVFGYDPEQCQCKLRTEPRVTLVSAKQQLVAREI
jgi:carbonic anhydrase